MTRFGAVGITMIGVLLSGCATKRGLPIVYMPDPPKECEYVMNGVDGKSGDKLFEVTPYPRGATTTGQVNVWLAKEGATRKNEREVSRVCAEYALRTAGVMADKDKPPSIGGGVNDVTAVDPPKRHGKAKLGAAAVKAGSSEPEGNPSRQSAPQEAAPAMTPDTSPEGGSGGGSGGMGDAKSPS